MDWSRWRISNIALEHIIVRHADNALNDADEFDHDSMVGKFINSLYMFHFNTPAFSCFSGIKDAVIMARLEKPISVFRIECSPMTL